MDKGKVIFLDFGVYTHTAIYASQKMNGIPADYVCLNMLISTLRRIGLSPFDTVIIACDGRHSWRKDIEGEYKGNRKKIDQYYWDKMDSLIEKLDKGTDWHVVKAKGIEADDWMAVGSRLFKDREVILSTIDSDLEQCWVYPNVKIYSIKRKFKGGKGAYKIPPKNFNVDVFIAKKIYKESSDNLVRKVETEADYNNREMVVSLLKLPDFVEHICLTGLNNLKKNGTSDLSLVPFPTLRNKLGNLYNDTAKLITYTECAKKEAEKENQKKQKKVKKRRSKK